MVGSSIYYLFRLHIAHHAAGAGIKGDWSGGIRLPVQAPTVTTSYGYIGRRRRRTGARNVRGNDRRRTERERKREEDDDGCWLLNEIFCLHAAAVVVAIALLLLSVEGKVGSY